MDARLCLEERIAGDAGGANEGGGDFDLDDRRRTLEERVLLLRELLSEEDGECIGQEARGLRRAAAFRPLAHPFRRLREIRGTYEARLILAPTDKLGFASARRRGSLPRPSYVRPRPIQMRSLVPNPAPATKSSRACSDAGPFCCVELSTRI